jgi:hypothetical protein
MAGELPMNKILPIAVLVLTSLGAARNPQPGLTNLEGHQSNLVATVSFSDGAVRTVTLEGVGCPTGMCSRVAVNARSKQNAPLSKRWLDSISAIQNITQTDALFLFKDGSAQKLSIVPLNRVLYTSMGKIDLSLVHSINFSAK